VDVELRKSMWAQVRDLRETGATVILTTHYIEEAEEMADRIGVINKGQLILTETKDALMQKMGKSQIVFTLRTPITEVPAVLAAYDLTMAEDGSKLIYSFNARQNGHDISDVIESLKAKDIRPKHIGSRESSLEDIFIQLVGE
jgi:ABC-2 type transport system ATP-binding protein